MAHPTLQQSTLVPNFGFGERLAESRKTLGLTQGELASVLGISRNSVTQYETDIHYPGAEVLVRMESAGIDILYVLTGKSAIPRETSLDLDRLALALQEARRQLGLPSDDIGQGEILSKAMVVYAALGQFLDTQFGKVQQSSR